MLPGLGSPESGQDCFIGVQYSDVNTVKLREGNRLCQGDAKEIQRVAISFPHVTLGAGAFAGRKFRDFRVFWHFSRKFRPRHNLKSKFAKVCAHEITENSRLAKVFSFQFFRFFKILCYGS